MFVELSKLIVPPSYSMVVSPECLEDVEQYLAPNGVMIPTNYTSYIAPVTAARVWMGARDMPSHKGEILIIMTN